MPQVCTVCAHPERRAIDVAVVSGTPNRRIASRYGVSEAAVRRHVASHLPAALARARDAAEQALAGDLLAQVRALQARALAILDVADSTGDQRTALAALREARGSLELIAKLTGAFREPIAQDSTGDVEYVAVWGDGTPCDTTPAVAIPFSNPDSASD